MKLVSYPTSPFARKVRIAAFEAGLLDRLEIVDANPLADDGVVAKHNPLGKVPALVLDDRTLVDSPLICAYWLLTCALCQMQSPSAPSPWAARWGTSIIATLR